MAGQGFVKFRENCYKVVTEAKTFQQSEDACKAMGDKVHLASIADIAEEALAVVLGVKDSSRPSDPINLWLGLTKAEDGRVAGDVHQLVQHEPQLGDVRHPAQPGDQVVPDQL